MRSSGILLALGILSAPLASATPPARPNIVYLYVDDMGWGSIGPNGQEARRIAGQAHVLTPNIDQLAAQGINFSRGYGCTVCSPARSSQQSGFHQGHTYADRNDTDNAKKAMRADDTLMGDALSDAGYVTGYWGKWGYGAEQAQNDPALLNLQTLPTSHGYDYVLTELHHVRAHTFFQPTLWSAPATPGTLGGIELIPNSVAAYANNPAYQESPANQSHASYPATAYCDDSYAFAALDFVRAQAQNYNSTGQPFFGLLAVQVPHSPYDDIADLPNWDEAYAGNVPFSTLTAQAKQWAAMVTRVDAHFGNILAALEDPNNDGDCSDSVAANTLVIFQSDNGGPANNARSEIDANGGLRGTKGSIWEGGIRVPLVMRWPSTITGSSPLKAGTSTDMVVDVTDLLPTFCDLAGVETPVGIDGISLAPALTGTGHQRSREFIIHEAGSNHSIIRGKHKLVGPGNTLYDLEADPDESDDISGANGALVTELSALMLGERVTEAQWFANTYHSWTGADGADTSDANNWSDYSYTNALNRITYQTDTGAPKLSWTAKMANAGPTHASANVDANLEFLGLEICGASPAATQTLDVNSKTLTGRNEIRLSAHSAIQLDNGTLESLRWVDVREEASITGAGTVDATLYNAGDVAVTSSSETTIPGPDITTPGPDITINDGHPYLSNGGFENGTDTGSGDYSYATLVDWFTDGPDASKDGAKPNSPHSGTMRGLINGANTNYQLIQTTAFPFLLGDSYTLTFWHQGFSNWSTGELAEVRVFYKNESGTRVDLLSDTFPLTNGTWLESTFNIPAVTDANAAGKAVEILLGPDTGTGFASFDDLSLVRHGPNTTVPGPGITVPGPDITLPGDRTLDVTGDYHEFAGSTLYLTLADTGTAGEDYAELVVTGAANLAGSLAVTVDPGFTPAHGDTFTVLTADSIDGTFANDRVTGSDDTKFDISYSATTVTLTVDGTTTQGTPYSWLEEHGIDGGDHEAADLLDHDGDGMFDWEEYIAGTDPTDPNSRFSSTLVPSTTDDGFSLRWASVADRIYTVEHSTTLQSFAPLAGPLPATPDENTFVVPSPTQPAEFFRVAVELPQ